MIYCTNEMSQWWFSQELSLCESSKFIVDDSSSLGVSKIGLYSQTIITNQYTNKQDP